MQHLKQKTDQCLPTGKALQQPAAGTSLEWNYTEQEKDGATDTHVRITLIHIIIILTEDAKAHSV